jgi:hypothetical protein
MVASVRLFLDAHEGEQLLEPAMYIKAAGEVLFLALIVGYALTLRHSPEILESNELKEMFGYNNPCVFIDKPPGAYVAVPMFSVCTYFSIRYAVTDSRRAAISPKIASWKKTLSIVANWQYALTMIISSLLFVETPDRNIKTHTSIFMCIMISRLLAVMMNFVEGFHYVTKAQWVYLFVYTCVTLTSFTLTAITLNAGHQVFSYYYMSFFDYSWFVMLPLTTYFFPDQGGVLFVRSELRRAVNNQNKRKRRQQQEMGVISTNIN